MNANREERLRMRQRGAATRKPKEFDFGFSLGLGSPIGGSEASSQPAGIFGALEQPHASAPQDNNEPLPPIAVQSQPAPSSPKVVGPSGDQVAGLQRTPVSARNTLPERPSMFDIPPDDDEEPSPVRSIKRRKIETPTKIRRSTGPGHDDLRAGRRSAMAVQDDSAKTAAVPPAEGQGAPPVGQGKEQPPNEIPIPSKLDAPVPMETQPDGEPGVKEESKEPQVAEAAPVQEAPEAEAQLAQETAPETASDMLQEAGMQAPAPQAAEEPAPQTESQGEPQETRDAQPRVATQEVQDSQAPAASPSRGAPETQAVPELPAQVVEEVPKPVPENAASQPQSQAKGKASPRRGAKGKRKKRESQEDGSSQPSPEDAAAPEAAHEQPGATQPEKPEPAARQEAKGKRRGRESQEEQPPVDVATEAVQPTQEPAKADKLASPDHMEEEPISKPREKRQPGRPPARLQESSAKGKESRDTAATDNSALDSGPRRRGRKTKDRKVPDTTTGEKSDQPEIRESQPEDAAEEAAPQPSTDTHTRKRGRPAEKAAQGTEEQTESVHESEEARQAEPDEPQRKTATDELQPRISPEGAKARKGGRPGKKAAPGPQEESRDEPEPAEALSTRGLDDTEQLAESRPAREQQPTEQGEAQQTEAAPRPARRKRRERGETIPVTVHRLANTPLLSGLHDPSDSEDSSPDELTTHQKHPNRGGVNQADVLGQICRETLEKTLTTLKGGIANETNPTRRAEWTRKKKAVEAFGSELEGRLFEMSEMLDSNFVLGLQLRRKKREMMEMRSRLYHVRREREVIALRMDGVRRRYAEGGRSRESRTTINKTLHSLELAVDRSQQHRPEESNDDGDASTAGLEYLLRAMAEEVSSHGDHGGLLNQIKAFNAELEGAARRLES